ncbi:hypothetical protein AVDCRST_MAG84-2311 [uncultured Microcoleus sp.]|uniref:Uncharacterized protein n=1 Tax=uncultured Microcoleus sp. TaxID=259945 RepID=A0A6J4LRA1_9CYAN|nr:hypothetical protein AVDCRST_MAG84-2311 [uncultured Microcoleus sp.]
MFIDAYKLNEVSQYYRRFHAPAAIEESASRIMTEICDRCLSPELV